jgi:tryptophan synthase alpha subunit
MACAYASGGIVGSKFVDLLGETNEPQKAISKLKELLK